MSFSTNNPYPKASYGGARKSMRGGKFGGKLSLGKLQKEISMLKKTIPKPEKKTWDYSENARVIPAAGFIQPLDGMAQGVNDNDRVGDCATMVSSHMRFSCTVDAGAFANNELVRVIVFIDHQTNGTDPVIADLLEAASPLAPVNDHNLQRFKIVFDQCLALNGLSEGFLVDEFYRKLKVKQTYADSAQTATTNGLYLCVVGETGAVAHISYYHRLRYTDV